MKFWGGLKSLEPFAELFGTFEFGGVSFKAFGHSKGSAEFCAWGLGGKFPARTIMQWLESLPALLLCASSVSIAQFT